MKWSELSMTEKNEVIKMAVAQGIRDISSIKNLYEESVNGSKRFEDGEDTNPAMTGMMKSKLATAAHFGNPTARRMTNYDTRSYTWPNEYEYDRGIGEPKRGNVYVGSYGNLVTPQIQDNGRNLEFVDDVWSPENDQRSYMQSLKFNNEKDARYFGEHYKEVAPMMHLYGNGGPKPVTTGGAGYIPSAPDIKKVAKESIMEVRQRLYDNIIPYGYHNPIGRTFSALVLNKPSDSEVMPSSGSVEALDELWAEYLQIPQSMRHYDPVLKKSKYKPTKAINKDASYFALPLDDEERQYIVNKALNKDNSGLNPELGRYKVDLGEDENGKYASYYDSWDINPFRGTTAVGGAVSRFLGLDKIKDVSMGIGKPIEVYDRIYFNDFGQAEPSIQVTLPEITVTGKKRKAEGGSIHIDPSKKGTFTAAASRHGKSVQEFASQVLTHKENYSPAMVKKANFARNASHWKH